MAYVRENRLLDSGWEFNLGDCTVAAAMGLNAADWQSVSIPHCWGWEDAQRGKSYYRGPGWYRRELKVTRETGKRYFLRFEAASTVAEVYFNGIIIGKHRGGFGAFVFEITTNLSATGTNHLAVRVSNAPEPDIAPLDGDFPVYGGLYRPVHLLVTGEENISPLDHGSSGIAWLQTSVSTTQAVLDVSVQISDAAKKKRELTLVASVFDTNGNRVASSEIKFTPVPNVTAPYFLRVTVPQPHLWNGRKDPYLYRAIVELRAADEVVDAVDQPLGLRFYSVDPDKGFFLNGQPNPLHGVARHQDRPGKGWAISEADMDEDMALIQEIGANVVRCAHYQHSDYFYRRCDEAGILVWAEIPQVNEIDPSPQFAETSRNQLLDLIRQNINHPAIFVWSLFNELCPGRPDPHRLLQDLNNLAHGEDPTRPTIGATMTEALPQMNKIPDLLGWNEYPGWYLGTNELETYGAKLDKFRLTSRHGGFCMSEYGAGANINQHEENPKQPVPTSQWHPEEWQSIVHEQLWPQLKSRPFVWATFAWNLADFTSYWRNEGGVPGRNDKGLVTANRKIRKDVFYFYKANWSTEPVLYITSRRFTARTNKTTDIKVYSNAKEVELFVSGVSQGRRADGINGVFNWPNIHLQPGDNLVEVRGEKDGQTLKDSSLLTLNSSPTKSTVTAKNQNTTADIQ